MESIEGEEEVEDEGGEINWEWETREDAVLLGGGWLSLVDGMFRSTINSRRDRILIL